MSEILPFEAYYGHSAGGLMPGVALELFRLNRLVRDTPGGLVVVSVKTPTETESGCAFPHIVKWGTETLYIGRLTEGNSIGILLDEFLMVVAFPTTGYFSARSVFDITNLGKDFEVSPHQYGMMRVEADVRALCVDFPEAFVLVGGVRAKGLEVLVGKEAVNAWFTERSRVNPAFTLDRFVSQVPTKL